MIVYLDTSAAAKLIVQETQSTRLAEELDRLAEEGARLVSSALLETELRRLAVREDLAQASVSAVLGGIDLAMPDRSLFFEAGILPGSRLRSLDAMHIATAVRLSVDDFVTYDVRQAEAVTRLGLRWLAPA